MTCIIKNISGVTQLSKGEISHQRKFLSLLFLFRPLNRGIDGSESRNHPNFKWKKKNFHFVFDVVYVRSGNRSRCINVYHGPPQNIQENETSYFLSHFQTFFNLFLTLLHSMKKMKLYFMQLFLYSCLVEDSWPTEFLPPSLKMASRMYTCPFCVPYMFWFNVKNLQ